LLQRNKKVMQMSGLVPKLLVSGSCRVHGPIQYAAAEGIATYVNRTLRFPHAYFFHTTAESLQFVRFAAGEIEIPASILPLVIFDGRFRPNPDAKAIMQSCDAVVLEVSTRTEYVSGGVLLAHNQIRRQFVTPGGPKCLAWWSNLSAEPAKRDALFEAALDEHRGLNTTLDPDLVACLRTMTTRTTTDADIVGDLRQFAQWLQRPVHVVTHFDAVGRDGLPIASRRKLITSVSNAANQNRMAVYQPGEILLEFGQENVILDGTNVVEYAVKFRPVVGRRIVASLLGSGRLQPTGRASTFTVVAREDVPLDLSGEETSDEEAVALPSKKLVAKADMVPVRKRDPVATSPLTQSRPDRSQVLTLVSALFMETDTFFQSIGAPPIAELERLRTVAFVDAIVCQMAPFPHCFEVGPATGVLTFALAALGQKASVVCGDSANAAGMEQLRAHLMQTWPLIAERATILIGVVPDCVKSAQSTRGLLISNDPVDAETDPASRARFVGKLRWFDCGLFNLKVFAPAPSLAPAVFADLRRSGCSEPVIIAAATADAAIEPMLIKAIA
jgi:hypothetical protein